MKHKLSIITLLLGTGALFAAGSSYAGDKGFYIGAAAGYSSINTPGGSVYDVGTSTTETLITQTSSDSTAGGFGGSIFAGYNINSTFAVELGYTSYADSNYSSDQSQYSNVGTDGDGNTEWAYTDSNSSSLNYKTHSIDLFLKGTVPVIAQVSAFAKLGVSYVSQSVDYVNSTGTPTINVNNSTLATPEAGSNTYTAFRPAGAVGLSYQATEHLSTSIFAQGFLGKGDMETDNNAIASAYVVGASVTYDFL